MRLVLRNLEVYPRFSVKKQRAIQELPYISGAFSFEQTHRAFWIDAGFSGASTTDLATTRFWAASRPRGRSADSRGILQGFLSGPPVRWLAAIDPIQRERFIVEQAESVFPELQEHLQVTASVCWDEDPWALGTAA